MKFGNYFRIKTVGRKEIFLYAETDVWNNLHLNFMHALYQWPTYVHFYFTGLVAIFTLCTKPFLSSRIVVAGWVKVLGKNRPARSGLSILDAVDEYALSRQPDPPSATQTVLRYREVRPVGIPGALLRKLRQGTLGFRIISSWWQYA